MSAYKGPVTVTLLIPDIEPAVRYYADVFEFELHGYWDPTSMAIVTNWVHDEPPMYAEMLVNNWGLGLRRNDRDVVPTGFELTIEVKDIEAVNQMLRNNGANPTDILDDLSAHRTFKLHDAFGFNWVFMGAPRA
jgi:uncharacterized glyoxalase superfamily protein PhnB